MDTYSVKQIAELLRTSEETVRRWIRNGKIHALQKSRKEGNVVSEAELNRFLINTPKYMAKYVRVVPTAPPMENLAVIAGGVAVSVLRGYIEQKKKTDIGVSAEEFQKYLRTNIRKLRKEEKEKEKLLFETQKELEVISERIEQLQYLLEHEEVLEKTISERISREEDIMWDYADLSRTAKSFGGPEKMFKYVEAIGIAKGKAEMRPWMAVTAFGGAVTSIGVLKLIDIFQTNKTFEKRRDELVKEIIQGIKQYDAEHPDETEEKQESGESKTEDSLIPIVCSACGGNYPVCAEDCPLMDR